MRSPLKDAFFSILDPWLMKLGARLAHLHALTPRVNAAQLAPMAQIDASASVMKTAKIYSVAPQRNIEVGAFSFIEGELIALAPGARLRIGHHTTVGAHTRIWACREIDIGNYVLISHQVDIHDSDSHPLDARLRRKQTVDFCEHHAPMAQSDVLSAAVRIEDDVWIGFKASILKGVTVGRGAVVAAGSVVTKDVPAFALVAGNPAKVVRDLTPSA